MPISNIMRSGNINALFLYQEIGQQAKSERLILSSLMLCRLLTLIAHELKIETPSLIQNN